MLPIFLELCLTFQKFWNTITKGNTTNALKIIEYIRKHNITKSEFCKKCNISLSTLDDIIYYGKNVDYMVAEKISDAMGIGVYALYSYEYNTNCSII